jgi:hypothetical protein
LDVPELPEQVTIQRYQVALVWFTFQVDALGPAFVQGPEEEVPVCHW